MKILTYFIQVLLLVFFFSYSKIVCSSEANEISISNSEKRYLQTEEVACRLLESNKALLCMVKVLQDSYRKSGEYLNNDSFVKKLEGNAKEACLSSIRVEERNIYNSFGDYIIYKRFSSSESVLYTLTLHKNSQTRARLLDEFAPDNATYPL